MDNPTFIGFVAFLLLCGLGYLIYRRKLAKKPYTPYNPPAAKGRPVERNRDNSKL